MAGVTLGSAEYQLTVDQQPFNRGLADAERTASSAAGRISGAFSGLGQKIGQSLGQSVSGAFSGLGGIVQTAVGGLSRTVSGAFSGIGSTISGALSSIPNAVGGAIRSLGAFGLAAQGVQSAIGALSGIGNAFGLGALGDLEQASASINAFTKDSAVTAKILADVRKEAALTPFAFNELATAVSSLMPAARQANVPLMDLLKTAEILAASNPAEGLEGAAFALREAVSGDFTSVIERFNLPRSAINKLKDEGVPALEAVRRAMRDMGFDADLISAKAATLSGRWSTFLDTISVLQTRAGAPIFEALKTGLEALQRVLDTSAPALEAFADLIATGLRDALADVGPRVTAFARSFGRAFETVSNVWREVSGLFRRGFGATATFNGLLSRLGLSDDAIATIRGAIAGLGRTFADLRQRAAPALEVLGRAFSNVMGIASRFIVALAPIAEWLRARIGPAIDLAIRAFGALHRAIRAALVLSEGRGVNGFFSELFNQLSGLGRRLMDEIGLQIGQIDWAGIWARMTTAGAAFLTWLGGIFVNVATQLAGWIGEQVAKVDWPAVWRRAVDVLSGMAAWFGDLTGRLLTWIGDAASKIEWRAVWLRVVDAMSGMVTLFIGLATKLAEWIGGEVSKIKWDEVWKQSTLTAKMVTDGLFAFDLAIGEWLDKQIKAVEWTELGRAFGKEVAGFFAVGFKQATDTGGLQARTIRKMIGDFVIGTIEGAIDIPKIGRIFADGLLGGWGFAIARATGRLLALLRDLFLDVLERAWNFAIRAWRPSMATVRFIIDIEAWGRQILSALQRAWNFVIGRWVPNLRINVSGSGSSSPPTPTPRPNPGGSSDGGTNTTPCPPGMVRTPAGCRWPDAYAAGTRYVPRDGLAYLHQGEAVIPAEVNRRLVAQQMAEPSLLAGGWSAPAAASDARALAGASYDNRSASAVTISPTIHVDARGVAGADGVADLVVAKTAQMVVKLLDRTERLHAEAVDRTLGGAI